MNPVELAVLHARCFTTPRPWSENEFRDLLTSDQVFLCNRAHGFLIGRIAGPEAELLTLAVDPDHRRLGTGRRLVDEFEETALGRGAGQAFLEVSSINDPAISLYKTMGYREVGYRKDYYSQASGQKISALVLTRDLGRG